MGRAHVAIIDDSAVRQLLSGRKRIETRFYCSRRPPFDRIGVGDRIYFKRAGGEIIGTTYARIILQFHALTPGRIDQLCHDHNCCVCAPAHYWRARRHCRYGVLIWIGPLEPAPRQIVVPRQYGSAWISLETRVRGRTPVFPFSSSFPVAGPGR